MNAYTQAEINRLADVMTDFVQTVHGSCRRQDGPAETQARWLAKTHLFTGNAVADWAGMVLDAKRGDYRDTKTPDYLREVLKKERV